MDTRISIDEMMLEICDIVSKRSSCLKSKVGCVLVRDGRIISSGYNGTLPKFDHCKEPKDCPRWDIESGKRYEVGDCQHAETNAILQAAKNGISTEDTDLYINKGCCRMCARNIISSGIKRVVYEKMDYDGIELLIRAGVQVVKYQRSINGTS